MLLFTSCGAYFNTFHNTKKYFNEARKEREKRQGDTPSANEQAKYNQTIEKASKILELYSESKYVDDAVMILGECFYYKGEYVKAERKFEELITYFPTSEYFNRAQLWLARTKIKMQDYLGARFLLQEFVSNASVKKELRDEGQFYLGEIQFEQEYFLEAEQEYRKAAEGANDKILKARIYFQMGASQIKIGDFPQAVQSLRKAIAHSSDKRFTFDAELRLATAMKLAGDYQGAKQLLAELLEDLTFKDQHGLVKLEVADCLYLEGRSLYEKLSVANVEHLGKIEQALDEYKKIALEYKKTEVAAEAYFEVAKIYEEDYGDFASAKDYYEKVKLESTKSECVPLSIQKAKDLADLLRLKSLVKKSQGTQLDKKKSGQSQLSDLELLLMEHGVHPELRFIQKKKKLDQQLQANLPQPQSNHSDAKSANGSQNQDLDALVTNKLQLAEVYLFQFAKIDSAMLEYNEVIELFPNHAGCAKALFSNALIYENEYGNKFKTDSLLYVLIERFPDSYQAQEARKILGLPMAVNRNELAVDMYKNAEKMLFTSSSVARAVEEFSKLKETFPGSEYAPKALFALGWVYERMTHENDKALAAYREIIEKYPNSDYSRTVKIKLDAVEKAAKQAEQEKQPAAPQQVATENGEQVSPELVSDKTDTTAAAPMKLSSTEAAEDSLRAQLEKINKERIEAVDEKVSKEKKPTP